MNITNNTAQGHTGTQVAGANRTKARDRRSRRVRKRRSGAAKTAPLTPRQRTFVSEYAQILNGSRPVKRAGCKVGTSRPHVSRLLRKPHVQKELQKLAQERAARLQLSAQNVVQELADIAFFDPRNLCDEHGHVKPIHTLDKRTAKGIEKFSCRKLYKGVGEKRRCVGQEWKFRFGRLRALVLLGKCLGLF
jgi:phage terminase small subunit